MIERLFKEKWLEKKHIYSFYMGVFYTLVSFITALILFNRSPNFIGISTILFIVILTLPSINNLFNMEEKLEKTKKSFLEKHETIFDFFIYFFIGVFLVFLVISFISPQLVLSGLTHKKAEIAVTSTNLPPPPVVSGSLVQSIFLNNLMVMLVSFVLSLFYGSGAVFLISLNGSIFAAALAQSVRARLTDSALFSTFSFLSCNTAIMFFHMLPELAGYFLAAISGGVLSKSFNKEKFMSKSFKIILKDSFTLLILGIVVLAIAAIIEVELSKKLFIANVCANNNFIFFLALALLALLAYFEFHRKKKKVNKKRTKRRKK